MHIAIDLGAESGRVIVGDLSTLDVVHRFPSRSVRVRGSLFWDILGIFSEIKSGLKLAFKKYGDGITSIGVDTWGVDYGLVDEGGYLLGNPFHYRDSRTDSVFRSVRAALGDERIYNATGIQFQPYNTLYQLKAEASSGGGRLSSADRVLTIPDLLNYWLSGEKSNEFSIATTTQLYNPVTGGWAMDIIRELGIPEKLFGEVVPPGTVLGQLAGDLVNELEAPRNVRIIAPACHDTGSAVAATPFSEGEDAVFISSGTWSLMGIELTAPLISRRTLEANLTNEGGAAGTTRFLKNIMGLWVLQECRKEWLKDGRPMKYSDIIAVAEDEPSPESVIDVNDPRLLKPALPGNGMVGRVQEICREMGTSPPESAGGVARLVIESLASSYAQTLRELSSITGKELKKIIVVGGGAKNTLLNSLTARYSGAEVQTGPGETTALGNILVQSVAEGEMRTIWEGRDIIRQEWPGSFFSSDGTVC